jgi:FG-GAP repeat
MTGRWFKRVTGCVASLVLAAGFGVVTAQPALALTCPSNVVGDINGDGHADAAIGELGAANMPVAVHVFYGTQGGLVASASGAALDDQLFTLSTTGVPGTARADDYLGDTVLADFNGDHCADLAFGVDAGTVTGGNPRTGFVDVLYGSTAGITTVGAQLLSEDSLFGAGSGQSDEIFGADLTSGDLNDDGYPDLVVGAPSERVGGVHAGGVAVIYGSANGLNQGSTPAVLVTQNTPGVPGTPEGNDTFGNALAAGDFDGDGVDDLAVGNFGENNYGIVEVIPGAAGTGLNPATAASFSQNTTGVPSSSESDDGFGFALAAGDVTGDGRADLAVGVPGENGGEGAVNFLRGSSTGLTGSAAQYWSQNTVGVTGVAGSSDGFGAALVMARLDSGSLVDLAIGVPGDSVGSVRDAGSVTILLGRSTGLSTAGAGGDRITQDTPGLPNTPERGDGFGFPLAAPLVQTPDQASLLIGVPGETVNGVVEAGLVHQLATNEFGPSTSGSKTFDQSSSGVKGDPVDFDQFGFSLS